MRTTSGWACCSKPLGRYAELRLSRNNAGILGTISSGIGNTMFRFLLIALCLVCASAFNVGAGAAALRSAQPVVSISMKAAAAPPKTEKELRAEAIAKAKAELAAAEAERAAALAEKDAALAALKKSKKAPEFKAPEFKAPALPKFSMPSMPKGSSAPSSGTSKLDTSNPAVQALAAGAAVGLLPAAAIISLRSFLASVRSRARCSRADSHQWCKPTVYSRARRTKPLAKILPCDRGVLTSIFLSRCAFAVAAGPLQVDRYLLARLVHAAGWLLVRRGAAGDTKPDEGITRGMGYCKAIKSQSGRLATACGHPCRRC